MSERSQQKIRGSWRQNFYVHSDKLCYKSHIKQRTTVRRGQRSRWGGGKRRFSKGNVELEAAVMWQSRGSIQEETVHSLWQQVNLCACVCVWALKRCNAVDYTPTLDFDDPYACAKAHTFHSHWVNAASSQHRWWALYPSKWHSDTKLLKVEAKRQQGEFPLWSHTQCALLVPSFPLKNSNFKPCLSAQIQSQQLILLRFLLYIEGKEGKWGLTSWLNIQYLWLNWSY